MTNLIVLPTVSESDELFINGFVIVQERQSAVVTAAAMNDSCAPRPVWNNPSPLQYNNEEIVRQRPHPMRQRSSFLWRENCKNKTKRQSRHSCSNRRTTVEAMKDSSSTTSNPTKITTITTVKHHIMETTQHTKSISDHLPRRPIRTLPSLYFP